jgi:hypothetical protein
MFYKTNIAWLLLGVFVASFVAMLVTFDVVCFLSMFLCLCGFFVNEYLIIQNKYDKRLEDLEYRLNQHLLENNIREM